jgi:hypothetical protein
VIFRADPRLSGRTNYSWHRRFRLAASAVVSFSILPLRVGIAVGLLTALVAFVYLGVAVVYALRGGDVPGWASVVGVSTLFFGVQFILTGLLGEYLGRVHMAAKRRPAYVVADRTEDRVAEDRTGALDARMGSSRAGL